MLHAKTVFPSRTSIGKWNPWSKNTSPSFCIVTFYFFIFNQPLIKPWHIKHYLICGFVIELCFVNRLFYFRFWFLIIVTLYDFNFLGNFLLFQLKSYDISSESCDIYFYRFFITVVFIRPAISSLSFSTSFLSLSISLNVESISDLHRVFLWE